MADWRSGRNLGPWPFIPQPDKYGYNNNPRWAYPATRLHDPCGHWHRSHLPVGSLDIDNVDFYQESIDVYHGKIAMVGLIADAPYGVACIEYIDNKWYALGAVKGLSYYLEPNTTRLTDKYVLYFGPGYLDADPTFNTCYVGVLRFDPLDYPRRISVWDSDSVSGIPYEAGDWVLYNAMDCYGTRAACIAPIIRESGVALNKFQIKVSNDSGYSFPTVWTFPTAMTTIGVGGYWDTAQLRMSEDGTVWVAYKRSSGATGSPVRKVEVWKSNPGATSWTQILDQDFYADMGNHDCNKMLFDVSDDGQVVSVRLNLTWGTTGYEAIYVSSNGGASFTTITNTYNHGHAFMPNPDPVPSHGKGTVNGVTTQHYSKSWWETGLPDRFARSSDYGDTQAFIDPTPIVLSGLYEDQQKHHDEIVYCECGIAFSPPAPSTDYISILYSNDNGLTWQVIQTPIPIYEIPGLTIPFYPCCDEYVTHSGPDTTVEIIPWVPGPTKYFSTAPGIEWFNMRWISIVVP